MAGNTPSKSKPAHLRSDSGNNDAPQRKAASGSTPRHAAWNTAAKASAPAADTSVEDMTVGGTAASIRGTFAGGEPVVDVATSSEVTSADGTPGFASSAKGSIRGSIVFVVAFFVLVLAPLVAMPFVHEDVSSEKRELAPAPSLTVDGKPNLNVLSETGDYFADHFAFRGTLVDLDATLKQRLFMTSATDNVVVGQDGWLYYAGTLNDYQRRNHMSDHELHNIAANLALVQEYVTGQGKGFALAIAPNKNTLYPERMPYYEMSVEGESNLQRLMPMLADRQINACDLTALFNEQDKVLYYARDSHWNGEGALLVYRAIGSALPSEHIPYDENDMYGLGHVGDVDAMLHPQTARPEDDVRPTAADAWTYTNDASSVEDDRIQTSSSAEGANGTLMMYRDSFGNNLLPYFAGAYSQATFSKLVPYDMGLSALADAQDVVIERAERHIDLFATRPPYMPAPERSIAAESEARPGSTTVRLSKNGPYFVVEGTLDETGAGENDAVFVETTSPEGDRRVFEAFRVSAAQDATQDFEGDGVAAEEEPTIQGDWGYRAFVRMDERGTAAFADVRVLVGSQESAAEVAHVTVGA